MAWRRAGPLALAHAVNGMANPMLNASRILNLDSHDWLFACTLPFGDPPATSYGLGGAGTRDLRVPRLCREPQRNCLTFRRFSQASRLPIMPRIGCSTFDNLRRM